VAKVKYKEWRNLGSLLEGESYEAMLLAKRMYKSEVKLRKKRVKHERSKYVEKLMDGKDPDF
jgi:hypothetical protein